jgi:DNA modification methylase
VRAPARPLTKRERQRLSELILSGQPIPSIYKPLLFPSPLEPSTSRLNQSREMSGAQLTLIERASPRFDERGQEGQPSISSGDTEPIKARPLSASGWRDRLILGDNLALLKTLLTPERQAEIEGAGGLKLIYIDPPFDVGADFMIETEVGEGEKGRGHAKLSSVAYRDRWDHLQGGYAQMLYERISLMRELIAPDGSIYVHVDYRVSGVTRLILDELFGPERLRNEIIWWYKDPSGSVKDRFKRKHDTLFFYAMSARTFFDRDAVRVPYSSGTKRQAQNGVKSFGRTVKLHPKGKLREDVWEIPILNSMAKERLGYPTQKPEALLEVILAASTRPGDLVADFFCGSGTTLAVAERMGRRWLGSDVGPLAIHTAHKRLLERRDSQSIASLPPEGEDALAMEIDLFHLRTPLLTLHNDEARRRGVITYILKRYLPQGASPLSSMVGEAESLSGPLVLGQRPLLACASDDESSLGRTQTVGQAIVYVCLDESLLTATLVESLVREARLREAIQVDILTPSTHLDYTDFEAIRAQLALDPFMVSIRVIPRELLRIDQAQISAQDLPRDDHFPVMGTPLISVLQANERALEGALSVVLSGFHLWSSPYDAAHMRADASWAPHGQGLIIEGGLLSQRSIKSRPQRLNSGAQTSNARASRKKSDRAIDEVLMTQHWSDWIDAWSVDFGTHKHVVSASSLSVERALCSSWRSMRRRGARGLVMRAPPYRCQRGEGHILKVRVVDLWGQGWTTSVKV